MRILASLLPIFILMAAFFFLGDFVRNYDFIDIWKQIAAIPRTHVMAATGLTCISYLLMSVYDLIGFVYLGKPFRKRLVMATSAAAYALNNSTGFGGVVGNAFRFRNYMYYGIRPLDILKVVSLVVLGFWLGTFFVTGITLLFYPLQFSAVPSFIFRLLGGIGIVLALGLLALTYYRREPLHFRLRALSLPSFRLTFFLIVVATADWVLGASVLYTLLPDQAQVFFPVFLAIFSTSIILGLITNMPGGLGVLETMILIFVGSSGATPNQIVGSLVAYRFIFNFCPFVIVLTVVGFVEIRRYVRRQAELRRNRVEIFSQSR